MSRVNMGLSRIRWWKKVIGYTEEELNNALKIAKTNTNKPDTDDIDGWMVLLFGHKLNDADVMARLLGSSNDNR